MKNLGPCPNSRACSESSDLDTLGWHKLNYSVERSVGMQLSNIDTMGRGGTPMTGHYIAPLDTPLGPNTIYSSLIVPLSVVFISAKDKKTDQNNRQAKRTSIITNGKLHNLIF